MMLPLKTAKGILSIDAQDEGIRSVTFAKRSVTKKDAKNFIAKLCEKELSEYFAGKRKTFSAPLQLQGTPFQKSVWRELQKVPFGSTLSYSDLARRIGKPRAVRAVASAVAKNPVGIIIPCHRVLPARKKGSSTVDIGKFAWGKDRKAWLLELEGFGRVKQ